MIDPLWANQFYIIFFARLAHNDFRRFVCHEDVNVGPVEYAVIAGLCGLGVINEHHGFFCTLLKCMLDGHALAVKAREAVQRGESAGGYKEKVRPSLVDRGDGILAVDAGVARVVKAAGQLDRFTGLLGQELSDGNAIGHNGQLDRRVELLGKAIGGRAGINKNMVSVMHKLGGQTTDQLLFFQIHSAAQIKGPDDRVVGQEGGAAVRALDRAFFFKQDQVAAHGRLAERTVQTLPQSHLHSHLLSDAGDTAVSLPKRLPDRSIIFLPCQALSCSIPSCCA